MSKVLHLIVVVTKKLTSSAIAMNENLFSGAIRISSMSSGLLMIVVHCSISGTLKVAFPYWSNREMSDQAYTVIDSLVHTL